jgi:hypothetical protein
MGASLGSHLFWLARRFTMTLECGHDQRRIRCAFDFSNPERLDPPLPARVRCSECPATPSRGGGPKPKKPPVYDPMIAALVTAMHKVDPRQESLLDWIQIYGRYVADDAWRARAYAAMACRAIDEYLPLTGNPAADGVRAAIAAWSADPSVELRAVVRTATRRLYGSQRSGGDWCAHRGIISAATIISPAPHNIAGILDCLTWDFGTRATYYCRLWDLRFQHDAVRKHEAEAFLADDPETISAANARAQAIMAEAAVVMRETWPTLDNKHLGLATELLAAYEGVVALAPDQKPVDA